MRAVKRRDAGDDDPQWLDKLADKCVELAIAGEGWAMKEIGDRLDGKPAQAIVGDNEADPVNLFHRIERAIVHKHADN